MPIEGAVLFELLLGVCLVYVINNIITWNPTNNWQDILCTMLWDRVYRTLLCFASISVLRFSRPINGPTR